MGHRGQEPNESTDDAVWQDLVARLEQTSASSPQDADPSSTSQPSSPSSPQHAGDNGDLIRSAAADDSTGPDPDREPPTDRERAEAIFRNQPFITGGPRDHSAPEDSDGSDADEGFVPPEPPPLGSGDPLIVLAWIGAAGGPIALLLIAMFWRSAPLGAMLGVLVVFLAGAGFLITRLPKHRNIGDDGAEV